MAHAQAPDQNVTKLRKEFDTKYAAAKNAELKFSGTIVTEKTKGLKPFSYLEITLPPKFAADGVVLVLAKKGKKEVGYTLVPFDAATLSVALKSGTWTNAAALATQLPVTKGKFDSLELRLLTFDNRRASATVKG